VSAEELVALVCCDLGAIVRGRSLPAGELSAQLAGGVGWVPANHALTPLGPLAEPNPFGSTGDLRLLPDPDTRTRVGALDSAPDGTPLELLLCDIVEIDGQPWECCPRQFLRGALEDLRSELGASVRASFEHEFQLLEQGAPALPFSLDALRRAEPFPAELIGALAQGGLEPERIFAEFASHQFEIPIAAAEGLAAADRAVLLRVIVHDVARRLGRSASFVPLLAPDEAGNGVHIHLTLLDADGRSLFFDAAQPACLSELGRRFAAGILRHARALSALCAASPVSGARLEPHRWSAGAACLGQANREALLRIPPLLTLAGRDPAEQLRLEFRGADASANPHLALGAIIRAGLTGVREQLPAAPMLECDPATLAGEDAERFGVGALPTTLAAALDALAADEHVRGWLSPLMYDAYVSLKRAELAAVDGLDLAQVCARYAAVY